MHRYRSPQEGRRLLWGLGVFHRDLRRSSLIKTKELFCQKTLALDPDPDSAQTRYEFGEYGSESQNTD